MDNDVSLIFLISIPTLLNNLKVIDNVRLWVSPLRYSIAFKLLKPLRIELIPLRFSTTYKSFNPLRLSKSSLSLRTSQSNKIYEKKYLCFVNIYLETQFRSCFCNGSDLLSQKNIKNIITFWVNSSPNREEIYREIYCIYKSSCVFYTSCN